MYEAKSISTSTTNSSWKIAFLSILSLATFGLLDASYLAYEHFTDSIPSCHIGVFSSDCGSVLQSQYAYLFGIPLAYIGVAYYLSILLIGLLSTQQSRRKLRLLLFPLSVGGFLASAYFMYLQLFVIGALCFYCLLSAFFSTTIAAITWLYMHRERKEFLVAVTALGYRFILRPLLFMRQPHVVHNGMTRLGEVIGNIPALRSLFAWAYAYTSPTIEQQYHGLHFPTPIGLAAGFDYNAQLTQTLGSMGFGFQSIGTITDQPCGGNPHPQLGRLIKSQSLMVNKGFRNPGAEKVVEKLTPYTFSIPVGVSVGQTNLESIDTVDAAIDDIIKTFQRFEQSTVSHSYYELNISCPNLKNHVDLYDPINLKQLLDRVQQLNVTRPIWVKMPISIENAQFDQILETLSKSNVVGIIVGNLQKDRNHPSLLKEEVAKFPSGNFSGKPTWDRSNELIKRAYEQYHDRFTIIGCGGVFSAQDAYTKIRLGASLIQLITGMIFKGPQLVASINLELEELLKADGFTNLSEAIGADTEIAK